MKSVHLLAVCSFNELVKVRGISLQGGCCKKTSNVSDSKVLWFYCATDPYTSLGIRQKTAFVSQMIVTVSIRQYNIHTARQIFIINCNNVCMKGKTASERDLYLCGFLYTEHQDGTVGTTNSLLKHYLTFIRLTLNAQDYYESVILDEIQVNITVIKKASPAISNSTLVSGALYPYGQHIVDGLCSSSLPVVSFCV